MIDWSGDPLFGTNTKLVSATTLQFWSRIVGCAVACTPQRPAKPGLIFFLQLGRRAGGHRLPAQPCPDVVRVDLDILTRIALAAWGGLHFQASA